jgi:hypothetical protein
MRLILDIPDLVKDGAAALIAACQTSIHPDWADAPDGRVWGVVRQGITYSVKKTKAGMIVRRQNDPHDD